MTDITKTTPAKASKPRVNRTPAQVAQDLLDAAKARHDRANKTAKRLDTERQDVEKRSNDANAEVQAAAAAVKYAEQHPDLPKTSQTERPPVTQTSGVS